MPRLVSFEVGADFGFFKKPDINSGYGGQLFLTYNLPPKPVILGLLGAILGFKGHKQYYEEIQSKKERQIKNFPEYYSKLSHLKIGIIPLGEFPFNKIINKYNSKNSYFGGSKYENVLICEQLLIRPKYLVYLFTKKNEDSVFKELVKSLNSNNSIYIPYLGKNDFILSIENLEEIKLEEIKEFNSISIKQKIAIKTIFLTNSAKSGTKHQEAFEMPKFHSVEGLSKDEFGKPIIDIDFYENYPIGYLDSSMQYNLKLARFTTFKVESDKLDTISGMLIEHNKQILYLF